MQIPLNTLLQLVFAWLIYVQINFHKRIKQLQKKKALNKISTVKKLIAWLDYFPNVFQHALNDEEKN